jgi:hypothetical protein
MIAPASLSQSMPSIAIKGEAAGAERNYASRRAFRGF